MLKREIIFALLEGRFEDAGEAIESEFKVLADRIKTLEESEKQTFKKWLQSSKLEKPVPTDASKLYPPDTLEREEDKAGVGRTGQPGDLVGVPTDRHGKSLKRGDVISYKDRNGKVFGIFSYIENDDIYADWMHSLNPYPHINFNAIANKDRVTFEFRPRFPDQKES